MRLGCNCTFEIGKNRVNKCLPKRQAIKWKLFSKGYSLNVNKLCCYKMHTSNIPPTYANRGLIRRRGLTGKLWFAHFIVVHFLHMFSWLSSAATKASSQLHTYIVFARRTNKKQSISYSSTGDQWNSASLYTNWAHMECQDVRATMHSKYTRGNIALQFE